MYERYLTYCDQNTDVQSNFAAKWMQRIQLLIQKDLFNKICGDINPQLSQRSLRIERSFMEKSHITLATLRKLDLLAFLDRSFKQSDVEILPNKKQIKYIKMLWCELYAKYKKYCEKNLFQPVTYSYFTIVR